MLEYRNPINIIFQCFCSAFFAKSNDSTTINFTYKLDIYIFWKGKLKYLIEFLFKMADYKELLEEVRKNLPESVFVKERFEIPKVMGHLQGNRTIIGNINQIADVLRRDINHLLKYVLKELAAPGEIKKSGALIIGTKVPASRINEKIRQYANEFVLCLECGKPDTQLVKEGELTYMKCTACGAKNFVKSKI